MDAEPAMRHLSGRRVPFALLLAAGLLALSGCTSDPSIALPSPTPSASLSDPVAYAAQIVRETNQVRVAQRLPELGDSECARTAALQRASNLIGASDLTHAPLAGVIKGCAPARPATPATTAAENLSRAAASAVAVVDAWMSSPGHRSNLLDPSLTEIGVGCVLDGQAMLCSQVFLGP